MVVPCPTRSRLILSSIAILSLLRAASTSAVCYYPDRSVASGDVPCSSEGNSTCCGQGFACLANHVCMRTDDAIGNENLLFVRGSCTDRTFKDIECPSFCAGPQNNQNGGNFMANCSSPGTYCCGGDTGCACNTGFKTISLDGGLNALTTIGFGGAGSGAQVATTIASSSRTNSATAESATSAASQSSGSASSGHASDSSPPPSSAVSTAGGSQSSSTSNPVPNSNNGVKIGIAVGIPIAALIFAILGYIIWRDRRHKLEVKDLREQILAERSPAWSGGQPVMPIVRHEVPVSDKLVSEMPQEPAVVELSAQNYERKSGTYQR